MTFNINYLVKLPVADNTDVTIDLSTGVGTQEGGSNLWTYNGSLAGDTQATVAASNYFASAALQLQLNDLIFASASDTFSVLRVSAITYPNYIGAGAAVTTVTYYGPSSIPTSFIQNNAVTYAKFQQVAANSIVGNPTGALANAQAIGIDSSLAFTGTNLQVSSVLGAPVTGTLSSAQLMGAYATPVSLVAAPGANRLLEVISFTLECVYGAAQYAAGGAALVQYTNTANGAGTAASATIAAATINGFAANSVILVNGVLGASANTAVVNQGLFFSNQTAAFTTGDSTFRYTLVYRTIVTTN